MTFNERRNFDGCGKPLDFQRMYCGKPSLGFRGVELGRSIFLKGECTFFWYFAK